MNELEGVYILYPLSEDSTYGSSKKDVPIQVGKYRTLRVHIGYKEVIATVVDYAKFYNGKVSGGESTSIDYGSFVANPTPVE